MENNTGVYFFGKLCAKVGAGLLLFWWLKDKFNKYDETIKTIDENGNEKVTLIIDDANMADYISEHPYDKNTNILVVPKNVDVVVFETTKQVSVHNVMPKSGDFANAKEMKIGGNWYPYQPTGDAEEYQFSTHIYTDMTRNNGSTAMRAKEQNCIEIMCWRKIWWFSV